MSVDVFYDEELQHLHAYCSECNGLFIIPCTPEQCDRYEHRNEPIQRIFPNLSPGEREVLKTGLCGYCYDGTTGFYHRSTPEMDAKVVEIHKELFPDHPDDKRPQTVHELWELYCEIQDYLTDYGDDAEPKAFQDLEVVKKALDDFISQIEKL